MNEQQMRQVLDWFHTKVGSITCSVCKHTGFKFDAELTTMPVWRCDPHPRVDFTNGSPAVILICSHCANFRLFSAERMGLIPTSTVRAEPTDLGHKRHS
jgi:hypothetical protein